VEAVDLAAAAGSGAAAVELRACRPTWLDRLKVASRTRAPAEVAAAGAAGVAPRLPPQRRLPRVAEPPAAVVAVGWAALGGFQALQAITGGGGGGGGFGGGGQAQVEPGDYLVVLELNGQKYTRKVRVEKADHTW
jgi:hypothetical protein